MLAGRDNFGRVFTKSSTQPVISHNRAQAQTKYGCAEGLKGNGLSIKTGIQGPSSWSALIIFSPDSTGADNFLVGWKDAPSSGTADRSIYVAAGGSAKAYLYDGAQKTLTIGTAVNGINVLAVRCNGSTLYGRLNDGAEQSLAVSNGGYTGYNTATAVMEAFTGVISAGNVNTAVTLHFMAFYNRCLSFGEALSFNQSPWRILGGRPSMERSAMGGGTSGSAARRRQILN